jgi:hypothetical protein
LGSGGEIVSGLTASEVSAVIVTRGDVDLNPILETLPYDEVIVWDNSTKDEDAKTFGRYLAMEETSHNVVYFQDDDVIFTAHDELLAAYEPGQVTCNMPSPWYEATQYEQLRCSQVGAGSLVPKNLSQPAFDRYLEHWPRDDLFLTYPDHIHGILTPFTRYDFGYVVLPYASAPGRIYTTPGADGRKWTVINRALELRDE